MFPSSIISCTWRTGRGKLVWPERQSVSTCTTALAGALPSRAAMPRAKREAPELEVPLGESCDRQTARPGEALASTRVSKDTASRTHTVCVGVGPLPALGPLHPAWGRVQCKSRVAVLLMGTPRAVPVHSTSLPCVSGLSSTATCVCMVSLLYLGETLYVRVQK